jgi:hypothetical protein
MLSECELRENSRKTPLLGFAFSLPQMPCEFLNCNHTMVSPSTAVTQS